MISARPITTKIDFVLSFSSSTLHLHPHSSPRTRLQPTRHNLPRILLPRRRINHLQAPRHTLLKPHRRTLHPRRSLPRLRLRPPGLQRHGRQPVVLDMHAPHHVIERGFGHAVAEPGPGHVGRHADAAQLRGDGDEFWIPGLRVAQEGFEGLEECEYADDVDLEVPDYFVRGRVERGFGGVGRGGVGYDGVDVGDPGGLESLQGGTWVAGDGGVDFDDVQCCAGGFGESVEVQGCF
jgi:hypothetical protein